VCEDLHGKFRAGTRSLVDQPCRHPSPAGRRDLGDRTQQVDKCGEVVRAHVEDGTASLGEQKTRD
jgi:hypothetical protein